MLGEPKFMKKDHLQFVANLEWNAADNADPDAASALSKHFQSLLDYGDSLRPIATNPQLVAQARSTIRNASIPSLIYSRLKRQYHEDGARAVHLDLASGVGVETVLRRKSGVSLSQPIPSFFSRVVFPEVATKQVPDLVKGFTDDDWVWGDVGAANRGSLRLGGEVVDLYEQDYIAAWEGILNDLQLAPFSSPTQAADALALLSGQTSPLRGLLAAVSDNTLLVQQSTAAPPTGAAGAAAAAKKAITDRLGAQGITDKLSGLFNDGKTARTPGVLVTAHFQPIHRLMAGEPGNAPIDGILVRIGQVEHELRTMGDRDRLQRLSDPQLREIVRSLRQEAETLPPVIQALIDEIGRRAEGSVVAGAAGEIETRYLRDVQHDCAQIVPGRYPFTAGSTTDIPLRDFAALFGIGGVYDKFFRENLEPLVDRSQSPWTWKAGAAAQAPRGILDQFEKAQDVRDLFFKRGGAELEVKFFITVAEVDASPIRTVLDIDGNQFEFRPPPRPQTAVWPGPNPTGSSILWQERYGGQPRISYAGAWAWFRLIDAAQQDRENETTYYLTFQNAGHRARIRLEVANLINPFTKRDWQRFTCQ